MSDPTDQSDKNDYSSVRTSEVELQVVQTDNGQQSAVTTSVVVEADTTATPRRNSGGIMGDVQPIHIIGAIVVVILGLLVILLPISFVGLEYYELGFLRKKSTGSVDTSRVYEGGKHALGPDGEFKVFNADSHTVEFNSVTVFASDRLQVSISCSFQYFLRPHQLELLHKNFDIHYEPVIRNNALDAVKGSATVYSTREYIRQRDSIEKTLFKAVRERLGGPCCEKDCYTKAECETKNCKLYEQCVEGCKPYEQCREADFGLFTEVRYFQLNRLEIPDELNQRYLRALTLQEETDTEQFKQDAQIVRKETESMVEDTNNKALEIGQNATAQSSLIKTRANANATAIVEKSRSDGLKYLYDELGLTDAQHKVSFDYLRTLKSQENVQMSFNYQTLITGPNKP